MAIESIRTMERPGRKRKPFSLYRRAVGANPAERQPDLMGFSFQSSASALHARRTRRHRFVCQEVPTSGRDNTLQERSTVQCPRLMRCRDLRWTRALADPTDPPQLKFLLRALEQTAYAWITYQLGRMAPPAPAHCGVWHDVHARSVEASD